VTHRLGIDPTRGYARGARKKSQDAVWGPLRKTKNCGSNSGAKYETASKKLPFGLGRFGQACTSATLLPMDNVGFVYDPTCLEHETGSHPENGNRMTATMSLLEESGLLKKLHRIEPRDATDDEIALVHDRRYIDAVRSAAGRGGGWADPDTLITPRSFDVAIRMAGATLAALDAILAGAVDSAYCLVRPPGHHATPVQAMGFCLLNHVAIAAAYARARHGLERVAIVDFDVHHGNGTQDAFSREPGVLYVSTHEYPFYPGTGAASETGEGAGAGTTINIPMPHGSGDAEHTRAFEEVVLPALHRYKPQAILVSAGFDAHYADDIALQQVSVDGYGALVGMLKSAAAELCDGRLLLAQEGGYHLVALPWCVRRSIEVLRGGKVTPDPLGPTTSRAPAGFDEMLAEVRALHGL
jgi:acetoin utilization deacetylase AcuC-like enzyme